jgi:autoinducer 2-degrading protein
MYVVCVTISVLPDQLEPFIEATLANARATRQEPANVRFDVLRALDDRTRFFLYEAYTDDAGFKAHQETAHYLAWRARVAPMMAAPRVGVKHEALFPDPWM